MRIPGRVVRFGALAALLAACVVVLAVAGLPAPETLAGILGGTGVPAPFVAVAGTALLVLGLVPRTFLAAVLGLVFGPVAGALYVIAGAILGALAAFGMGRWLGRDFVAVQRRAQPLDGWLTDRGVLGVVTVRLLPVAPFGLTSYLFGTTGVRLAAFGLGTLVGMVPTSFVYATLGANASRPGSTAFWAAAICAVVMWLLTASLTVWLSRRRAPAPPPAPASSPASAPAPAP